MNTPLRIGLENIINIKERVEEEIAGSKGIFALKVPILMYHHINSGIPSYGNPNLYVNEELFIKEMKYLTDNDYNTITIDDLVEALKKKIKLPKKSIIITFDDGNYDFYTKAFPILKKLKLKCTIFVIMKMLNKRNYLTVDLLRQINISTLVTIGSHSVTHKNLTKLNHKELVDELKKSKNFLEEMLRRKVNSFAYPFGKYNKIIISEIQKTGYMNAVSTNYGSLHTITNIFELKRIRIGNKLKLSDYIRRIRYNS